MRYIRYSQGRYDIIYDDYDDKVITHNSYERRKKDGAIDALKKYYSKNKSAKINYHYQEQNKESISSKVNKKSPFAEEMLKEVIPKKVPTKKANEKKSKVKWLILTLLILVLGFFIYVLFLNIPTKIKVIMSQTEKTKLENVTVLDKLPINVSFYNITNNLGAYNQKNLTLKGFLEQRLESTNGGGVYVNYIVDDNGNSIKLLFRAEKSALQNEFFNKPGKSKELYQVSGVFTTKIETGLQVNEISLSTREFIDSTHQEIREINYTENLSLLKKFILIADNSRYLFSFT